MRILIYFIILTFSCTNLTAQNIFLKGRVLCNSDSIPIEYVQIYIKQEGIGTVTNKAGKFKLSLNEEFLNDTIIFQHIAYKQLKLSLKDIKQEEQNIFLTPNSHIINEINIVSQDSLRNIIQQATRNIRINYPNHLHCMSAYFRQTTIDQTTKNANSLIETALYIQDRGNNSSVNNIKYQIIEMRRSDNQNKYSFLSKFLDKIFEKSNEVYNILERNPIRNYYNKNNVEKVTGSFRRIASENIKYYLQKTIRKKDRLIWVINYENPKPISVLFKEYGTIYINSTDYAIEKIICNTSINPDLKKKPNFQTINYEVTYKKLNNKYYLTYILEKRQHYASNSSIEEKLLLINDHFLNRKKIEKIKNKFKESRCISLNEKNYEYNEDFWSHYNIVKEEPLSEEIIKSLEQKNKLKKQFLNNSKN